MKSLKLVFNDEVDCGVEEGVFLGLFEKFCQLLTNRIEEMMYSQSGEVNLALVSDENIHLINRDFRGHDKATDVIACAYLEDNVVQFMEEVPTVGDIYISIDTAKRQAEERSHSLQKELEILFVHGLLHTFGFDHQDDAEEEEMEGWAKKILGY